MTALASWSASGSVAALPPSSARAGGRKRPGQPGCSRETPGRRAAAAVAVSGSAPRSEARPSPEGAAAGAAGAGRALLRRRGPSPLLGPGPQPPRSALASSRSPLPAHPPHLCPGANTPRAALAGVRGEPAGRGAPVPDRLTAQRRTRSGESQRRLARPWRPGPDHVW